MIYSKNILQRVKREDFSTTISSEVVWDNGISPEHYFNPLIEQIKKFAVGQYFWFIANLMEGSVFKTGGMVEYISGIKSGELEKSAPDLLFQRTHQEDIQQLFAFTNQWISLVAQLPMEQKNQIHPTIYMRLKNNQEKYHWVMIQYADHIFDNEGNILFGFTLVTDISHIKKDGFAMMSVLNSSTELCQHFYCSENGSLVEDNTNVAKLTMREIEVLNYISIGLSSKQIAAELSISIKTVDNHRQNMLQKTNSKSTGELISFSIKSGYL